MARKRNTKTIISILLGVIAVALLGLVIYTKYFQPKTKPSQPDTTYHPKAAEGTTAKPTDSGGPTSKTAPPAAIAPSSSPQSSPSGTITVTTPTQGSTITNGSHLTGTAPGGSQIYYRVKGKQSGQVVYSGPINVPASGQYDVSVVFTNGVTAYPGNLDSGVVEVFSLTNQVETNIASVQVYLQ